MVTQTVSKISKIKNRQAHGYMAMKNEKDSGEELGGWQGSHEKALPVGQAV
jgi:hypothetical protein